MKHAEWGLLIVNYLFLGGLSAGLFFASALVTLTRPSSGKLERVARWGALLAPWPVALGCTLLIFDLGRWYAFYKLFFHFRWTSPMSIGSWLLIGFAVLAFIYAWTWLPVESRQRLLRRLPGRLSSLGSSARDFSAAHRPLALIGLPLSVAVGIYTGVLLGAIQSRPFWNTNLIAQLFLFSALSTGCAALILAISFDRNDENPEALRFLYSFDLILLGLELFIVVPYVIHSQLSVRAVQSSLQLILGGPFTVQFWLFFFGFGLLLPLVIEFREITPVLIRGGALHSRKPVTVATALLILMGGFLLRYVFVFAGQMSAFH
jgi:formate-dependent nitrite reductase membrane component NrfD